MMHRTGGGRFDPDQRGLYFTASNVDRQRYGAGRGAHRYPLTAVNEIGGPEDEREVERWIDAGAVLFLDSGIFNLAGDHMRRHPGMTLREAFQLPPEHVDGYQALLDRYVRLVRRWSDRLWGYVELDLGGTAAKRRTRARLEDKLGLTPIPVYHPRDDPWEYFDELAATYDRVCIGNLADGDRVTRKRLVATIWERHRDYPDLWIHMLGLTPNDWLLAYPPDSADSSSWLSSVRWSGFKETAALRTLGAMPRDYQYALGGDPSGPTGNQKATEMSAAGCHFMVANWAQAATAAEQQLGLPRYPEPAPAERPIRRGLEPV